MAKLQLQYGSQGSDVKELQRILNNNGYNLTADGVFGTKTQAAVKDYQQKNGLAVDGIVGNNTWGALLGGSASSSANNNALAAPTMKPLPTAPTYDTTSWDDTTKGQAALGAYNTAKDKVNNYGDFTYANQAQLDAIMNSILNREKFSYNFNEDAFYQQYKDKFTKQGKMAMADVMGQAAAMTGGYGNSYAASVGNQAYQAQLENLNDVIPELYQMALDQYNMEGQDLYNKYGMLVDDRGFAYGQYQDGYNKLMDALGIARGDYYDGADMFYTEQNNKNSIAGQQFNDAMALWNSENANAWNEAEWNRDQAWRDEDTAYRDSRDKVADEQWQKEFDAQYGNTTVGPNGKTTVDSNTKLYSGTTPDGSNYNNGSLTTAQVKELQAALGVTADGYYGDASKKAAGGLSAAEAYDKYVGGNGGKGDDEPKTGEISDDIRNKAASFTDNDALDDYLTKQYQAGHITEEQMGQLYLENETPSLSKRNWTAGNDGGVNWFWGIDNNATVKDQYGNEYRLDKLVDALVAEGMSKSEAKEYVKNLQAQLGL